MRLAHGLSRERRGPNNKISVSILQAFGVNENSFGSATDPAITTGTLAELKG